MTVPRLRMSWLRAVVLVMGARDVAQRESFSKSGPVATTHPEKQSVIKSHRSITWSAPISRSVDVPQVLSHIAESQVWLVWQRHLLFIADS
jgi:hypothetical protein